MPPARTTIYALSSGRPPAAIAVVRISGPHTGDALAALTGMRPAPRQAVLARVRDPQSGETIDEALALWFPAPHSETGEDVAELQLHGGRAVIAATLEALGRIEGLRMAEPGEFTRRAFENGKLDLVAIEGLADLIGAETEAQRRQAYRQLKGLLGDRAESWRTQLIEALALIEARIDFSDEADVPEDLVGPALKIVQGLRDEISAALNSAQRGERLRDGLTVAIAGPPNAGKSTLLNLLARREAAIVSPIPGTTRDVIEVHLDLGGYPVTVLDTAGIRDSDDPVEQEGVRRARERAGEADLILWVVDASADTEIISEEAAPLTANDPPKWWVLNKADLASNTEIHKLTDEFILSIISFNVSCKTGEGLSALFSRLTEYAAKYFGKEPALVTRERQKTALRSTVDSLDRALAEARRHQPNIREEVLAEELRHAAQTLGRLTGRVDVEDILDAIFRDFCIGK